MIRDLHPHTRPQRTRSPEHVDEHARELGYEPRDWPVGKIARGFAALFLLLGIITVVAAPAVRWLGPDWKTSSALAAKQAFRAPAPQLEAAPRIDRARLEAAQRANLRRAPRGVDAAMREVAARGWQDGEGKR